MVQGPLNQVLNHTMLRNIVSVEQLFMHHNAKVNNHVSHTPGTWDHVNGIL
jgi:hypothetical protein